MSPVLQCLGRLAAESCSYGLVVTEQFLVNVPGCSVVIFCFSNYRNAGHSDTQLYFKAKGLQ